MMFAETKRSVLHTQYEETELRDTRLTKTRSQNMAALKEGEEEAEYGSHQQRQTQHGQ